VATAQIIKLKEELAVIGSQIGDMETRAKTFGDPSAVMVASLEALREKVQKRATRTQEWAKEIETLSSGKIIAEVLPENNVTAVRDAIEAMVAKTGSQESHRTRQVDELIRIHGAWGALDRLRTEALALLHYRLLGAASDSEEPNATDLYAVLGGGEKTRAALVDLLDVARISAMATAAPNPQIELSYADGDRKIAFEKASEGQRAGALLFMLLEQPGGPLLIDQPEGDLDNSIITDLTNKLHLAKQRRQLIFASHNANIVVNGSSELVGHLRVDASGGRSFDAIGAIDSKNVRDVITLTMEGGETAFRDRQDKYGF
jgi:type III restriction enzyme